MEILEIALVSIGLAMDALAVAICKGLSMKKMEWKKAIIIGLWFGVFQGGMPVIGYFLGNTFEHFIISIDHWVSFILLGCIGGNMIKEAFDKERESSNDDISFKSMFALAIATSIDALVVGTAYVCAYGSENASIAFLSIGIITFLISVLGVKAGNKFGDKYKKKSQFAGGLILVILGTKILLEHIGII